MLDLTSLHPFISLSNSCSSYFYILVQFFIYSVSLSFCHFLTHFLCLTVCFISASFCCRQPLTVSWLLVRCFSLCSVSVLSFYNIMTLCVHANYCQRCLLSKCLLKMTQEKKSWDLQPGWTWLLSAGLFVFCRLGLARCSAAHWCGLWGVQTSFPSPCWWGPHPLFWLSTRIQHCRKVPVKWSGTQMQSEKETWVCEGQTGRAHTPQAGHLVRWSALSAFWNSPVGGNWQKFREEGWWLVWPLYSGTYTTVRALEEALFLRVRLYCFI